MNTLIVNDIMAIETDTPLPVGVERQLDELLANRRVTLNLDGGSEVQVALYYENEAAHLVFSSRATPLVEALILPGYLGRRQSGSFRASRQGLGSGRAGGDGYTSPKPDPIPWNCTEIRRHFADLTLTQAAQLRGIEALFTIAYIRRKSPARSC
jgi:hypothetical protein